MCPSQHVEQNSLQEKQSKQQNSEEATSGEAWSLSCAGRQSERQENWGNVNCNERPSAAEGVWSQVLPRVLPRLWCSSASGTFWLSAGILASSRGNASTRKHRREITYSIQSSAESCSKSIGFAFILDWQKKKRADEEPQSFSLPEGRNR